MSVFLVCWVLFSVNPQDCIEEAQGLYDMGQFAQSIETLKACLDRDKPDKVRTYALMAKAYVMLDQHDLAEQAIGVLLANDREYEASPLDPYVFVRLLRNHKKSIEARRVGSVSGSDEQIENAPATVLVITAEDIHRGGYTDLPAVLMDLPGFDYSVINGFDYAVFHARGFINDSTSHLLLRIDGVEQNQPIHSSIQLSRQYPLSMIQRIEVVYGPVSTIYGPNGFAGVIDVISKPAGGSEEDGKIEVDLNVGGGELGTGFVDTFVSGAAFGSRLNWRLTARYFHSDEQDLSDLGDHPSAPLWDNFPGGFSDRTEDWFLGGRAEVGGFKFGFQSWQWREGSLPSVNDGRFSDFRQRDRRLALFASYHKSFNERFNTTLNMTYSNHRADPKDFSIAFTNGNIRNQENKGKKLDLDFKFFYHLYGRTTLTGGLDWQSHTNTDFRVDTNDGDFQRIFYFNTEQSNTGVYGQLTTRFEDVTFILGARYDDKQIIPGLYQNYRVGNQGPPINPPDVQFWVNGDTDEQFSPRYAVTYTPGKYVIKGVYATAFSDATNIDANGTWIVAKDVIKTTELIFGAHEEHWDLEASVFHSNYSLETDELMEDSNHGFQLHGSYEPRPSFYLEANFTHMNKGASTSSLEDSGELDRSDEIAGTSWHLILGGNVFPWLGIDARTSWIGEKAYIDPQSKSRSRVAAYSSTDLTFTFQTSRGLNLQVINKNLFDEAYDHPGLRDNAALLYPQPGRLHYLKINYQF